MKERESIGGALSNLKNFRKIISKMRQLNRGLNLSYKMYFILYFYNDFESLVESQFLILLIFFKIVKFT